MNLEQRIENQTMGSLDKASLLELEEMYADEIEIADRTGFTEEDSNLIDMLEAMHPILKTH